MIMEWGQSTSIEGRMSGLFATEPETVLQHRDVQDLNRNGFDPPYCNRGTYFSHYLRLTMIG